MKKREFIVIDTIWYRISNFFRKIFNLNKKYNDILPTNTENTDKDSFTSGKLEKGTQIEKIKNKQVLAEKLMRREVNINTLSDSEVIEMTEYFNKYINEMNQRLKVIKTRILKMREEYRNE